MKKPAILLLMALFCLNAKPCGNFYGHTMEGERMHLPFMYLTRDMMAFDKVSIKNNLQKLRKQLNEGNGNFKTESDIALYLMKLGKADSALIILRPLAISHPNEYNIMANLGTAYELTGQLDSALKYIRRDLEINSESHWQSEWIHEKILLAKIREKRSPGWLYTHSILDLNEMITSINSDLPTRDLFRYNENIMQQIRTRVPFTPAPNKVITNLLLTLGDLNYKKGTYEMALLAYAHAIKFEESKYRKESIYDRIVKLNLARDSSGKYPEVPYMFVDLMKRSKLDPELLMAGLDKLAPLIDSVYESGAMQRNTIRTLEKQVDSLNKLKKGQSKTTNNTSTDNNFLILYLLSGFSGGILITFLFVRFRKKN